MKRISLYILVIIFVSVIIPFSFSVNSNGTTIIQNNVAYADDYQTNLQALKDAIATAVQTATALGNYIKTNTADPTSSTFQALSENYQNTYLKVVQAAANLGAMDLTPTQTAEVQKIVDDGKAAIQLGLSGEGNNIPVNIAPQTTQTKGNNVYTLLAPIGTLTCMSSDGTDKDGTPNKCVKGGIGDYLNTLFLLIIGLCGALAVIMIIVHGVQYMGDESVFGKTEAKGKIMSAILGLIIALGSYALLKTIDPALTGQNGVSVDQVEADIEGDAQAPVTVNAQTATSIGIMCPGTGGKSSIPAIAKSFAGKMTYSQNIPKGQPGPNGTIYLDCSGYVNYVLKCAGINNSKINSGTSIIFSNAEKVIDSSTTTDSSINGKPLEVGDLVGWRPQDDKRGNGHVMIYIGDGQVVNDSHGGSGRTPGKAYGSFGLTKYKSLITYVKRISTL